MASLSAQKPPVQKQNQSQQKPANQGKIQLEQQQNSAQQRQTSQDRLKNESNIKNQNVPSQVQQQQQFEKESGQLQVRQSQQNQKSQNVNQIQQQQQQNAQSSAPPKLLGETVEKSTAILNSIEQRIGKMKGVIELKTKLTSLNETLKKVYASDFSQNQALQSVAFLNTIAEVQENLDLVDYQSHKYADSNAVKKKMIQGDVRSKLKTLRFNIAFMDKMIDAMFLNNFIMQQKPAQSGDKKQIIIPQGGINSALSQEIQQKINEMDQQLEILRKQQMQSEEKMYREQQKLNQNLQKREKADIRKQEEEEKKQAMLNQMEEESKQQKLSLQAENYCFQADCMFFGFGLIENVEQAQELYQKSAQLGNPKAMMALGRIYENGIGTKVDMSKAYSYYDAAASQNEPYALFWLGNQCELGQVPEMKGVANMALALSFYKKAAEKECKEAYFKIGYFYQYGIEVEKNLQLAIRKYEEGAACGDEISMNALGSLFYNEQKDYRQAFEWFRKASERGYARALNNLAICYELGHGIEVDTDIALQLYSESRKKGYTPAILNLGQLYFQKARLSHSQELYQQAANIFIEIVQREPKSAECYFNLGQLFENGYGVDRDFSTAFRYYKKAVALNHVKAYTKCGDLLYSGKGCGKRDKTEAFKCYHKAAQMNDAEALNNLALMIEMGFDDRVSDTEQAIELYKKAIKLGSSDAAINLALIYLNVYLTFIFIIALLQGLYVEKDQTQGQILLRQAFKQGNEKAIEYMIQFNIIKSKNDLEAEMQISEEELASNIALSSNGFNQISNNLQTFQSKRTIPVEENRSKDTNAFNSISGPWAKDENQPPLRSSLRSINNSSKNMAINNVFIGGSLGNPSYVNVSQKSQYYQY